MYPLFETIFISQGRPMFANYHWERMKHSAESLWGIRLSFGPGALLALPFTPEYNKVYRCRMEYDTENCFMRMEEYHYHPIRTLQLVEAGTMDYPFKFTDRRMIEERYARRGTCHDILIVRDGMITDTSTANIVFRKEGKLYTPSAPLLRGTARARLLNKGKINEISISVDELGRYSGFTLINALRVHYFPDFSPISNIRF